MRIVQASLLQTAVYDCLGRLGAAIDPVVKNLIEQARDHESSGLAKDILNTLLDNYALAESRGKPLCQDTGTVVCLVELGEDVCIEGSLTHSINQAVREAYQDNYYRKSIVSDPVFGRENSKDNTPAIIHIQSVPGESIRLNIALKGGGAENMSAIKMLKPADGVQGIRDFVLETVRKAGSNPCPPIIIGVGVGGNFEQCAFLAKKALLRETGSQHPAAQWRALEAELLDLVNQTGIGAMGMGGRTTALSVQIETAHCHIAALPVAVNIDCHAHRHETVVL